MPDWIRTLLNLLFQVVGGRGGNQITNNAIAAIFWSICLALTVARYREDHRTRERLLIWGFSVVLGRELFMIGIEVLRSFKLLESAALNAIYPPLQHALHDAGLITVAAGFMGFLGKDDRRAGQLLRAGMAGTAACYLATFISWPTYLRAHPGSKFAQTWCDWPFHINGSVWLLVALVYLVRHTRGWVRNGVCGALAAFFLSTALKLPDLAMQEVHVQIFTPVRYLLYLIGAVTLSYVFIREQFSDRREYARSLEKTMREQEKVKTALRESAESLLEAQHMARIGSWTWEPGGTHTWSQVMFDLVSVPPGEPPDAEHFLQIVHPDDRKTAAHRFDKWLRSDRTSDEWEYRIVLPDGAVRNIHAIGHLVRDSSGRPIRATGTVQDLTERKKAEAAVHEGEQRFRELFEGSPDAIFVEDFEGCVLDVNPEACRLHGMERGELIGKSVFDLIPVGEREAVRRDFLRMTAGEVTVIEGFSQATAGHSVPVEVRINRIIYRDRPALLLHVRDITTRRQAESAVRESQRRLSFALQQSHTGGWELDLVDHTSHRTPEHDRIFGYDTLLPEWTYEIFLEHVIPEDRPEVDRSFRAATTAQSDWNLECRIRRKDGAVRWIMAAGGHQRDESGQARRIAGIVQDITVRKQAEAALRQSEERKAAIFASALDALITMDGKGTVVEWNPAAERVFGYRREDAIGREIAGMIIPPRLREAHRESLARFLATGEGTLLRKLVELPALRADGTEFPVELFVTRIQSEPPLFTGFIRDITERRATEEKIRGLAAFPELNPNPVLEFAADGALTYHNRAASELAKSLGVPEIGALLLDATREIVLSCLATDQPQLRVESTHGPRTLSWSFYPIGELRAVHCYVGEITGRLRLEEQLRQAQKMEAIGQLAGGVAHDFNNILTVIQGYGAMLLMATDTPEERADSVQQIIAASERAANLTRQLLLFSRRQVMQPRLLNLNDLVTSLVKMLQRIVGEDVKQQLHLHPRPLAVYGDAGMLDQVLMNLVVNARDAMPGGGRLIIETAEKILTETEATLIPDAKAGHYACLSVTDSGIGIAPEDLAHTFEPFFTTKEVGKGTGLGLATVFGIVQQHGGALQVESELGRGTTFHIFLPTVEAAEVAEEKVAAKSLPRGTETILVVEDEPSLRLLNRIVLERQGYQVLDAAHGVEALQVWERHTGPIHLLLTDLVMPEGLSGLELAARLRKLSPHLPVIFTSGYSAEMAGRELRLETGQYFLQKPTPLPELLETVRRCLDR